MGIKEDAEALGEDPDERRRIIESLPPFDPNAYVIIEVNPKKDSKAPPTKGGSDRGKKSTSKPPAGARGKKAVQEIEKNFSGDQDTDGVCAKCIARGFAKGAAIAAAVTLFLALLPLEIAAAVIVVLLLVAVKGIMDLADNWGKMNSHQKQEAVAEIAGAAVVGGAGAKWGPAPGSLSPKGGFGGSSVAMTPEGIPMPVPDAVPVAKPTVSSGAAAATGPMATTGGGDSGGSDDPPKKKLSAKERRARDQEREAQRRGGDSEPDGTPRNNKDQNRMFDEIAQGLDESQRRRLHDEITKQNLSRDEIIAMRNALFPNNPYPGS